MRVTAFHYGAHVAEHDLLPPEERCPACLRIGGRRAVFRVQEEPRIVMLACPACRVASASRMPTPAVLQRYYASYYQGKDEKLTCPDVPGMARRLVRYVASAPPGRTLRLLDFGGGDGSLGRGVADALLSRQRQARIEVDVVDYQAVGPYSTNRIAVTGFRNLDEITGSYDFVIASAILEHIPEVHDVVVRLLGSVNPGGAFYARTPWVLPLAGVARNLDLTFPAHVHDMGALFWNRAAQTFGVRATYAFSRPSPVETIFRANPFRSVAATLLKLPALLEGSVFADTTRDPFWRFVGGWEVMLLLSGG